MPTTLEDLIADAVDAVEWPAPSARKSGRDHRWPYVPVLRYRTGGPGGAGYEKQLLGLAYATRIGALEAAERNVSIQRSHLAVQLAQPHKRALREHHGLPREIS